ncbi:MAG: hypothetical protein Salg2KO_17770 [Salibacteraceae bacterium]
MGLPILPNVNLARYHQILWCSVFLITAFIVGCEREPFEPKKKPSAVVINDSTNDTTTSDTVVIGGDTIYINDTIILIDTIYIDTVSQDTNDSIGPDPCDTSDYSYSGFIEPLLISNNCRSCHSSGAGGVTLNNYTGVKNSVDAGTFLGAIRHDPGYKKMPQGGQKLDSCTIVNIELWINNGAPND